HHLFTTTVVVIGRTGVIGVIAIATTAIIVVTTAIEPGIDHRGDAVCRCPGGVFICKAAFGLPCALCAA
ncbi:MAG: hypothetical protein KC656_37985, partial [Myxococcales bacterium]|nr:hypothetical protein [Myxococcales bacterium]